VTGDDAGDGMNAGDGSVQCDSGTAIVCNGVCVSASDPGHCGSCSNACPGPEAGTGMAQCTLSADGGGVCSVQCGGTTSEQCGGSCFDPHDPNHCGSCTTVCPGPSNGNGMATCTGTTPTCGIACSSGYNACNGQCLPNSSDPSTDPCIVSDTFGVFVSPLGHAGAAGTQADPLNTIGAGIAQAAMGSQKRVFVCAGTYDEQIAPASSADGVSVYGGLDCTNWSYSTSNKVKVAPSAQGYALQVQSLTTGMTFEDIEFDAQDAPQSPPASGPGASSIAVFASGAKLMLTRVTVVAGKAQPGAAGGQFGNYANSNAPAGSNGTAAAGGPEVTNSCLDAMSSSTGGKGGDPGGTPKDGTAQPTVGMSNAGTSGTGTCSDGNSGANGFAATTAASGGASSGQVSGSGWQPGQGGGDGADGDPGQGGGGGGSKSIFGGGSGGAGGCGGGRGLAGQTGGSSIGVIAYQSSLVLQHTLITASAGGSGGAGGNGQPGQVPGGGGIGACNGGTGGVGGGGSGGGGGAAGLSAGIVWSGTTPPNIDGTSEPSAMTLPAVISLGAAGAAGAGGTGGQASGGIQGANGEAGAAGQAMAVVQQ